MSKLPNDQFHSDDDEDREVDADTELILDYLSNKLDAQDVAALESRATSDKDFRHKLADVVLLKGLVMMALDKNPSPEVRECRQTQRLFLDYLRGRTSAADTARLSRHIEDCFECELAFERFESREADVGERGGWGGLWRRFEQSGRRILVASLVVSALAAGAFGVFGMLTSAAADGTAARQGAPGGLARPASMLVDADAVHASAAQVRAQHPELAESSRFEELVAEILDEARTPKERGDSYAQLGADFGAKAEPILWAAASNETTRMGRESAYRAINLGASAIGSLRDALRREVSDHSPAALLLVRAAVRNVDADLLAILRALFEPDDSVEPVWRAQMLRGVYEFAKSDPVIERRMRASLASPNDQVRVHAVSGAVASGDVAKLSIAIELLHARDDTARTLAAVLITRHGSADDFKRLFDIDWSGNDQVIAAIRARANKDGITLPISPLYQP